MKKLSFLLILSLFVVIACDDDDTNNNTATYCGDNICNGAETATTCATDCEVAPYCGDGTCDTPDENETNCATDCEVTEYCGDGTCDTPDENETNCATDCEVAAYCGDGTCLLPETQITCATDCGVAPFCGDGTCLGSEDATDCYVDCGSCGDGMCNIPENDTTCATDCLGVPFCGDGTCLGLEDATNCYSDCGTCGDGFCTGTETVVTCATDCTVAPFCGDGTCDAPGETTANCATDCSAGSFCGDDVREGTEVCDGDDTAALACSDDGYDYGQIKCKTDCTGADYSSCYNSVYECGNNIVEGSESCDGTSVVGLLCSDFGYTSGDVGCNSDCTWDLSQCVGDYCQAQGWYGDGFCDDCEFLGGVYDTDCDSCIADGNCIDYFSNQTNSYNCEGVMGERDPDCGTCGDATTNWNVYGFEVEQCDGNEFSNASTCADLSLDGTDLACSSNCKIDSSVCVDPFCGDDLVNGAEDCEALVAFTEDCTSFSGYTGGTLGCTSCSWDYSSCDALTCNSIPLGTWAGNPMSFPTENVCTGSDFYNGGSCLPYGGSFGNELIYELTIPAGMSVHVNVASVNDTSIYVISDCINVNGESGGVCYDEGVENDDEFLDIDNTGTSAAVYYIVIDHWTDTDPLCSSGSVLFDLQLTAN
jgi:hypothetical protein